MSAWLERRPVLGSLIAGIVAAVAHNYNASNFRLCGFQHHSAVVIRQDKLFLIGFFGCFIAAFGIFLFIFCILGLLRGIKRYHNLYPARSVNRGNNAFETFFKRFLI